MSLRIEEIALVHRVVGTKHVFTSPDVPELHISHADRQSAYDGIQPALDLLESMKARIEARENVRRQKREQAAA